MNTRRFEDLFYRFSLRPSLFICERFSRHSSSVQMQFARFSNTFCGTDFYGTFSALHGSLRQACLILGPGWVRRGREPSTPRRALSCLNDIATMSASYLALSCREHVLPLRQQNSLARMASVNSSSAFRGHRRAGRGARRHMAATEPLLIACKQGSIVSSRASRAWQAVMLHSSQHSELLGIDSLIMKCGICGSQIMVLILARDTTHWAVRVLSSSSVPAHLPINWLEGA